jgi:hypothetical protein
MLRFSKWRGRDAYTAHWSGETTFVHTAVARHGDGWGMQYEHVENASPCTRLDERALWFRTREQAEGAAHALMYGALNPNVVALLPGPKGGVPTFAEAVQALMRGEPEVSPC